ncbi:MAG: AAA family ATPase [Candidatus Harrisonbacteria bacterium]|nr:AAA family ATPase [Candidatus Harrisonbacteria bacterium]
MKGITLIGMPGSGKSTIGKLLAKKLGCKFVDLDILIKEKENRGHEEILEKDGGAELLRLENLYTLDLDLENTVFSPGGSIVYSLPAMRKLQKETNIIYLKLPLLEIENRLGGKIDSRGIVGFKEKGIKKLFRERDILYKNFSHKIISCLGLDKEQLIYEILQHQ